MTSLAKRCGIAAAVVLAVASGVQAAPDGRGTAMGGAYSPLAEGAEGMWYNPAVLGAPTLGSLMIGFGLDAGNNMFSLSEIGTLVAGASDADKAEAVQRLRDSSEGQWAAEVPAVGGVALAVKGFGIGVFPQAHISADEVSPDLLEFALYYPNYGNVTGDPISWLTDSENWAYDFSGSFTQSAYTEIGVGYGREIVGLIPGVSLSAGGAVKMYYGHSYEHVSINQVAAFPPVVPIPVLGGTGAIHEESSSGQGLGADLGVHAKFLGSLHGSIVMKNIGGTIKWTDVEKKVGMMNLLTRDFDMIEIPGGGEDVKEDVPNLLLVGVGGTVPVIGTSAVVEMESNTTDSETMIRLGVEQKLFAVLALRAGYVSEAGASPSMVTFGVGLGALVARLDVGAAMATGGKGGSVAASFNLGF